MAIQTTRKEIEMAKGNRYTKNGAVTGSVDLMVTRIGDHIYLSIKGQEISGGVEVRVDDWIRLVTPRRRPPVGFTINTWRENGGHRTNSVSISNGT